MGRGDWYAQRGLRVFALRSALYALLFITISFLVGGVIVPGPLLYGLGFFVYGGLGYTFLAIIIFFLVFARAKLIRLRAAPAGAWWLYPLVAGGVWLFIVIGRSLQANPAYALAHRIPYAIGLHALFLTIFILLGFAVFSARFVRTFLRDFRRELLICVGIGVLFYAVMRLVWLSWPILSLGVSHLVQYLLAVYPGGVSIVPPQTIVVGKFAVFIGEACSGVYSIFLFTCLYLLIIALDWKKLHHGKAIALFFVAVLGLYLVNVLRVYLIILVGALISADLAANLFHSYVGMILFMAYFALFMWLCYGWMKR